jgi:hypothetical protein
MMNVKCSVNTASTQELMTREQATRHVHPQHRALISQPDLPGAVTGMLYDIIIGSTHKISGIIRICGVHDIQQLGIESLRLFIWLAGWLSVYVFASCVLFLLTGPTTQPCYSLPSPEPGWDIQLYG